MKRYSPEGDIRYYIDEKGYLCPSVTSVLGCVVPGYLRDWWIKNSQKDIKKISGDAADVGTELHEIIEGVLEGKDVEIPRKYMVLVNKVKALVEEKFPKLEILKVEERMSHPRYHFAGSADLIV